MSHVSLLPKHTVLVVSKEFQHSRHVVHTLLFITTKLEMTKFVVLYVLHPKNFSCKNINGLPL